MAGGTVGALYFTNQSLHATSNQYWFSQQTAVTDRFRLAADQLGSDKINVRLSGIYLLERLAKDSPADHATVFAVIAAFVRTQTTATDCATPPAARPVDVQAALTVISRREPIHERNEDKPDLHQTCLTRASLYRSNLANTWLAAANLTGADLRGANLTNANLTEANLTGVIAFNADLSGADLTGVNLTSANLYGANLGDANLSGANLSGAGLYGVNLTGAGLRNTNLSGADLKATNLSGADLTGTIYNDNTLWPEGFVPPPQ
ncbi:pentapeptide repeat-containing protein [Nocardia beijingensis]|uniref:pentapeptide repeat-containing protein n=1 Tax=Nocardia beijingensis TaxID=95162 RepID=UPI00344B7C3F